MFGIIRGPDNLRNDDLLQTVAEARQECAKSAQTDTDRVSNSKYSDPVLNIVVPV